MVTVSETEKQLRELLSIKPKGGESRQAFLGRVLVSVQDLSDDKWESLPEDVQTWANDAVRSKNANKDLPDFSGEADDDAPEEDDPKPNGKHAPKAKDKDVKADKKAASAKGKEDKPEKAAKKPETVPAVRAVKPDGMKYRLKKLLIRNPSMAVGDLKAALEKSGGSPTDLTISGIRAEFRHSLKVLQAEGKLTGIEI